MSDPSKEIPEDEALHVLDRTYKWEITPHLDPDYGYYVTDSDKEALQTILGTAEMHLWDAAEEGETRTLSVKLNRVEVAPSNSTSATVAGSVEGDPYLFGSCTEFECRLCRLPGYARRPGMTHSGISVYPTPPETRVATCPDCGHDEGYQQDDGICYFPIETPQSTSHSSNPCGHKCVFTEPDTCPDFQVEVAQIAARKAAHLLVCRRCAPELAIREKAQIHTAPSGTQSVDPVEVIQSEQGWKEIEPFIDAGIVQPVTAQPAGELLPRLKLAETWEARAKELQARAGSRTGSRTSNASCMAAADTLRGCAKQLRADTRSTVTREEAKQRARAIIGPYMSIGVNTTGAAIVERITDELLRKDKEPGE